MWTFRAPEPLIACRYSFNFEPGIFGGTDVHVPIFTWNFVTDASAFVSCPSKTFQFLKNWNIFKSRLKEKPRRGFIDFLARWIER